MPMKNIFDTAYAKCEWQVTIPEDKPNLPGFKAAVSNNYNLPSSPGRMVKAMDGNYRRGVIIFTLCDNVVIYEKYPGQEEFCVEMNSLVRDFTGVTHNLDTMGMLTLIGDRQTPNVGINMERFLKEMSKRSIEKWWRAFKSDFDGDELNTIPPNVHLGEFPSLRSPKD